MPHAPLTAITQKAQSGRTDSIVILIHGYGANGDDLIEIGKQWAPGFVNTTFIAVNAPEPCPMAPGGLQWFPLNHNPGGMRDPNEYWGGVTHAEKALSDFIDKCLEEYSLDESRCILVGFSQGTMMALHVGLRRKKQLAGIIGYSGVLAGADKLLETEITKPPVLLTHGELDPVIPVQAIDLAKEGLRAAGIDPQWYIAAHLGHSIDPIGLALGQNFLLRTLG